MVFTVPDSTPPSTPDKSRSLFSNPSTTPAGPPPPSSSAHGLPNSSTFGNSRMGSISNPNFSESTFSQSGNFGNDSLFSSFSSSKLPPMHNAKNSIFSGSFGNQGAFKPVNNSNGLKVRNKKPHGLSQMSAASEDWEDEEEDAEGEEEEEEMEEEEEYEDEEEEEYEDEGEEELEEGDEDQDDGDSEGDMEMDNTSNFTGLQNEFTNSIFSKSFGQSAAPVPAQKRIYSNPNNAKRAKLDEQWATSSPNSAKDIPSPRKKPSQFPSVARDLASRAKVAAVTEPGEVVLPTHEYIGELLDRLQDTEVDDPDASVWISEAIAALTDLWLAACEKKREQSGRQRVNDDFGPGDNATGLEKATVLASLLLRLHHPPVKNSSPRDFQSSFNRNPGKSLVVSASSAKKFVPMPKVLIDWLNENHLGSEHESEALRQTSPNPTASPDFWEIVQAGVLRGRFGDMAELLRSADFNYARSALKDGFSQPGYRGMQLQSVQKAVNKVIQILEASPINRDDDWDITGFEWAAYRKRVHSAQSELQEFAEGENAPQQPGGGLGFEASRFGMSHDFAPAQSGFSFTQSLRQAESRIPWSIYQGINNIYGVILGETLAITSVSQDWIESTIGLTAWWDGQENSKVGNKNPRSLLHTGAVDGDTQATYLRRLDDSFAAVTEGAESTSLPNPLDPLDVGVACMFEGNVIGAVKLLQTWSLCIAATVAELAHEGGWLSNPTLPGFLNQNDLMVLSYGQPDALNLDQLTKDDVLDVYSSGLGYRDYFQYNGTVRKGWQMALEILSRMDDANRTKERVAALLDQIPVDKIEQVEQVIILCGDLGFEDEGRKIAANFGEQIIAAGQSHADCDYGLAMICFARARSIRKVKEIANNLIAYSLQQSRAWPPDEQLGGSLRSLVKSPKLCLSSIAKFDGEAAQILQFYASGYATLRRFYDLRDEPVLSKDAQPQLRPLARKRAAAEALVAVIRSSADSIYGGLYDTERDSAVLVDNLLALLGEAIVFVNQTPSILSIEQQSTILAAIEDLETVTPRVFAAAQEFFYECLNEYIFENTGETRKTSSSPFSSFAAGGMKKTTSALTTSSSSFSLIDSHMADSAITNETNNTTNTTSSGVMVPKPDTARIYATPIQRGWDWRVGLAESPAADAVAEQEEVKPENKLLRVLRLRLAQGMIR